MLLGSRSIHLNLHGLVSFYIHSYRCIWIWICSCRFPWMRKDSSKCVLIDIDMYASAQICTPWCWSTLICIVDSFNRACCVNLHVFVYIDVYLSVVIVIYLYGSTRIWMVLSRYEWMYMASYVYIYIYIYMYTHTQTHIYRYIHVYIHVYIYLYQMLIHTYVSLFFIGPFIWCMLIRFDIYMYRYVHIHTHLYIAWLVQICTDLHRVI